MWSRITRRYIHLYLRLSFGSKKTKIIWFVLLGTSIPFENFSWLFLRMGIHGWKMQCKTARALCVAVGATKDEVKRVCEALWLEHLSYKPVLYETTFIKLMQATETVD